MSTQRASQSDLHEYLREELGARHWGVRQLSQALGVRYGVAARWVTDNPAARVVPVPATLAQIAIILQLDPVEAFRHAGYLPILDSTNSQHPHWQEYERLVRRFQRMLMTVPEPQWTMALLYVGLEVDHMQVVLNRLGEVLDMFSQAP